MWERAQRAGDARADMEIDDVLRVIFGVTAGAYRMEDARGAPPEPLAATT